MKYLVIISLIVAAFIAGVAVLSGRMEEMPVGAQSETTAVQVTETLLDKHRGKVLVLLVGMEGCPETRRITPLLEAFNQNKEPDVFVARVETPPPGGTTKPPAEWKYSYVLETDEERHLADKLEFFYYPTLYVIDRDGVTRFAGGYEADKVRKIVAEIAAEPRGLAKKKMYTPPLPAVGTKAPEFAGVDLSGRKQKLSQMLGTKSTLLFFGSSSCPFSVKALAELRTIAESLGKKGLAVIVINKNEPEASVRKVYKENNPGVPVLLDTDGTICKAYSVEPVPFQFVLNAKGEIAQRSPFTAANATNALNKIMGTSAAACNTSPSGAG